MKRGLLLLAALLCALGYQVKAQGWRGLQHEVSLSYGGLPVTDLLSYYEDYFNPDPSTGADLFDDKGKFGALNISYLFYPDDNLGFGVVYSYTNSDKRIVRNNKLAGDFYNSFHSICPSVKYNWYNYNFITLYSRINAGVAISTTRATYINTELGPEEKTAAKVFFMYQVSPIGIEVGRQIAGFVEAGFGHMGTVMAGLRYRM